MGDINYAPVILDMTWSYSRLHSFDDCPYRWYLRYIRQCPPKELFFSSYGKFVHELLCSYYRDGVSRDRIAQRFLTEFRESVPRAAPSRKVLMNYFWDALRYLENMEPLPYKPLAVEERCSFQCGGFTMTGIIDFVGERDGELVVVDHKSRKIKPRSGKGKATKSDELLDAYLRQLYLYAEAVREKFGKLPAALCLNCFREGLLIEEPFSPEQFQAAKTWAAEQVERIAGESDFRPDMDFFKCRYLCEMQDDCEYYQMNNSGRRNT